MPQLGRPDSFWLSGSDTGKSLMQESAQHQVIGDSSESGPVPPLSHERTSHNPYRVFLTSSSFAACGIGPRSLPEPWRPSRPPAAISRPVVGSATGRRPETILRIAEVWPPEPRTLIGSSIHLWDWARPARA